MRTDSQAGRLHVVVAPDKFKSSLSAVQAAQAMRAGVLDAAPDATVHVLPMADGREGTLEVVLAAGGRFVEATVSGPTVRPVSAGFVVLDGVAYVESARACGTEFVEPSSRAALHSHTWGVGELLAAAFDLRVRGVVLSVGGTASSDGGAGMLAALGCAVLDPTDSASRLSAQVFATSYPSISHPPGSAVPRSRSRSLRTWRARW